jgi:hypothetical protein
LSPFSIECCRLWSVIIVARCWWCWGCCMLLLSVGCSKGKWEFIDCSTTGKFVVLEFEVWWVVGLSVAGCSGRGVTWGTSECESCELRWMCAGWGSRSISSLYGNGAESKEGELVFSFWTWWAAEVPLLLWTEALV